MGIAGPKGDRGDIGPRGEKGDIGPIGPKGDKGDDSLYIGSNPPEDVSIWLDPTEESITYVTREELAAVLSGIALAEEGLF